jgi:hypothetical protein
MNARLSIAAAVAAALGVVTVIACDDVESYLYSAQKYDPANACVEAYAPVEIVNGSGANATCPGTCFSIGGVVYVTSVCPPLPPSAEELARDSGECLAAVGAAPCGETAEEEDGGEEAGEEDGGEDSGEEDAPADAGADG